MYFPFGCKRTSVKKSSLKNKTSLDDKKLHLTKIVKKNRTWSLIVVAIISAIIAANATANDENIFLKGWHVMTTKYKEHQIIRLIAEKSEESVTAVAWSPDGKTIATTGESQRATLWDAASLSIRKRFDRKFGGHGCDSITFSPDSKYVVSGFGIVNVWKVVDGTLQTKLIAQHVTPGVPQELDIASIRFSPDGKMLIVVHNGEKKIVIAYRIENWEIAWSYEPQKTTLFTTPLVFTPDGKYIILGEGELFGSNFTAKFLPKLLILNAVSGKFLRNIDDIHVENPTALAISPDGKWLATGTETGSETNGIENKDPVRIWNFETGKLVKELPVQSRVWSLSFSRNGKYLFGSKSQRHTHLTLAVWDMESGEMVQEVKSNPGPMSLAVSPDGKRLAAACQNKLSIYEIMKGY